MMKTAFFTALLFFCAASCGCGGSLVRTGFDAARYRWDKPTLTYRFVPAVDATAIDTTPISAVAVSDAQKDAIRRGLSLWQGAGGPSVEEAAEGAASADIDVVAQTPAQFKDTTSRATATGPGAVPASDIITWNETETENGKDTDDDHSGSNHNTRDFGGDTLASCSIYAPNGGEIIGRAVIRLKSDLSGARLSRVGAHETGHALGLPHSKDVRDVMYPIAYGIAEQLSPGLGAGDRRFVRARYGR